MKNPPKSYDVEYTEENENKGMGWVMQRLFSVTDRDAINRVSARFKDDSGNEFPDWEAKNFGRYQRVYVFISLANC